MAIGRDAASPAAARRWERSSPWTHTDRLASLGLLCCLAVDCAGGCLGWETAPLGCWRSAGDDRCARLSGLSVCCMKECFLTLLGGFLGPAAAT